MKCLKMFLMFGVIGLGLSGCLHDNLSVEGLKNGSDKAITGFRKIINGYCKAPEGVRGTVRSNINDGWEHSIEVRCSGDS